MNAKKIITTLVALLILLALAPPAQGAAPQAFNALLWRDDFDGSIQPGWTWVNENPGEWSLEASPGFLTIWTSPYGTGGQNLLLRSAPAGDFTIQTRLLMQPDTNFQFAGLVIWQDFENFLQYGRAYCDIPEVCAGNGIYFDQAQGGASVGGNFATPTENTGEAYLRLIRRGSSIKSYYSDNGFDWTLTGEHTLPVGFQFNGVGLTSAQNFFAEYAIPADFDYFALNVVSNPFAGEWQALDIDGGNIRLSIGGSPSGPFQITWTEAYFGFCGGSAGIARGMGWLNESDPNMLEADLTLKCFTTGAKITFHVAWRYDAVTGWLASRDEGFGGLITTWHHPGETLPLRWDKIIAHPDEEWVEGMDFPEGMVVSLAIFAPDGTRLFLGTATAGYSDDPNHTKAVFYLDFDLKDGDHLWMYDGMVAKDLYVTNLQISEINLPAHTVSGSAAPGSEVIIEYPPDVYFTVTADAMGNWTAALPGLEAGIPGLASQADQDWDLTRVVFYLPRLDLRVNYGDDWVESFFPAGHTIDITVTDADGNPKATAQVVTTPRDEWGGAEGFQTRPEDWLPGPPVIQPHDWVLAQADSGQTAAVQIGEISGVIDLDNDSISGTVLAGWLDSEVSVECLPWGAPSSAELKYDAVYPDGSDTFSCSWNGEWDIQAGEAVGVGYYGPDGHWVANTFFVPALIEVTSTEDLLKEGWSIR